MNATPITPSVTHANLRQWAEGRHPTEAATELLIRALGGRFADPGYPWIRADHDADGAWWWIDWNQINEDTTGVYSSGERAVLELAASLGGGRPVDLSAALTSLDLRNAAVVLAAVAHAAGTHEPTGTPLYDWPR